MRSTTWTGTASRQAMVQVRGCVRRCRIVCMHVCVGAHPGPVHAAASGLPSARRWKRALLRPPLSHPNLEGSAKALLRTRHPRLKLFFPFSDALLSGIKDRVWWPGVGRHGGGRGEGGHG